MRNIPTLKNYQDFQKVYSKRKSFANKYLIMYVLTTGQDVSRIGISVSKKVGNSIVRHRVTRLIRESFRLNRENLKKGVDIVVVARPQAKDQGFFEIEHAYLQLLRRFHLYEEPKASEPAKQEENYAPV